MSRRIFFGLLAATSAMIATQAFANPQIAQLRPDGEGSGVQRFAMKGFHGGAKVTHGFHGGAKRAHAGGKGFKRGLRSFFPGGWPAYAVPAEVSGYPVPVVAPGFEFGDYDRRDCDCGPFGYHPFGVQGHWPPGIFPGSGAAPVYILAPDARIISVEQDD